MNGFYNRLLFINVTSKSFQVQTISDQLLGRFYRDLYQWEELSTILEGTTGLKLDKNGLRSIAANVSNCARKFNLREGLRPEHDQLPKRFHKEALEQGKIISDEEMKILLKDYYRARGWTDEGIPVDG